MQIPLDIFIYFSWIESNTRFFRDTAAAAAAGNIRPTSQPCHSMAFSKKPLYTYESGLSNSPGDTELILLKTSRFLLASTQFYRQTGLSKYYEGLDKSIKLLLLLNLRLFSRFPFTHAQSFPHVSQQLTTCECIIIVWQAISFRVESQRSYHLIDNYSLTHDTSFASRYSTVVHMHCAPAR